MVVMFVCSIMQNCTSLSSFRSKRDEIFEIDWNGMTDEEKQVWMEKVLEKTRVFRRRVNPPRRFGKRSMIVGGSWG